MKGETRERTSQSFEEWEMMVHAKNARPHFNIRKSESNHLGWVLKLRNLLPCQSWASPRPCRKEFEQPFLTINLGGVVQINWLAASVELREFLTDFKSGLLRRQRCLKYDFYNKVCWVHKKAALQFHVATCSCAASSVPRSSSGIWNS